MKKNYTYTIPEFQSYHTSSRLWRLFAFSLLCFLLYPATGLQANTTANANMVADQLTVTIENHLGPGWISCNHEKVTLVATVYLNGVQQNPDGISFSWTGPEGYKSTGSRIAVTVAGEYVLTVQNAAGLTASAKYVVRGVAGAAGADKVIRTSETSVQLAAESHPWETFGFTPSWTASNGGNIVSGADTFTPSVGAPGTYTLTLTHTSGCTMEDQVEVTEGEDVLEVYIGRGSVLQIDCYGTPIHAYTHVYLNGDEVTEGLTYKWSGPNGFSSEGSGPTISEPGDYTVVVTYLATGLTATATREISQRPRPEGSAGPDKVLTRDNPTVTLEGSVVNNSGQPTWLASDGGNFVSGYRTLNPIVDAPGTYTLVLQDGRGCKTEYTVKVTKAEDQFIARIGDGSSKQLDCDRNPITLNAYATLNGEEIKEGITYSWTGPTGYTSIQQKAIIYEPGDYTLVATHIATGATATATMTVSRMPSPEGSAGPDKVLTRENPTVRLEGSVVPGSVPNDFYEVMWFNNVGASIKEPWSLNPEVDTPGTYRMVITDRLGKCTFVDEVVVTREEGESPLVARISTSGVPQLGCDPADSFYMMGVAMLDGQTVTEGITYKWNGPNGYTSNDKNVSVTEAGDYTLMVTYTARNLTATSEPIRVSRYTLPEGSAGPEKVLTCKNRTVTLEGSGHGMVQWVASHGGNIVSGHNTLNPVVDAPGIYTMELNLMRGGCVSYFTVKVIREEDMTVNATGGQLYCTTGTVQLTSSSSAENATYSWTGPNGYTSAEQNPVVKVAGTYTLTLADSDGGCTASTSVVVTPSSTEVTMTQHLIDFDDQPRGLISSIDTEAGPVAITGRKRNPDGTYAPENHAAIFDSQDPTGDDTNLYTTDWGQVLIINQYQNDYPDATQWGGELILDFSAIGPVTMESFRVVGMDKFEDLSWVYLYDANGKELNKVYLKPLGMNSKQLVNLGNTRGVMKMKVVLDGRDGSGDFAGSAAIDNIKFHTESVTSSPCTVAVENFTHAMAYPTAFSDRTTVEFIVRETENYSINLYDAQGMLVKQLQSGTARAGEMTRVEVNGKDLKEGMYFARLVGSSGSKTFKLVLKR